MANCKDLRSINNAHVHCKSPAKIKPPSSSVSVIFFNYSIHRLLWMKTKLLQHWKTLQRNNCRLTRFWAKKKMFHIWMLVPAKSSYNIKIAKTILMLYSMDYGKLRQTTHVNFCLAKIKLSSSSVGAIFFNYLIHRLLWINFFYWTLEDNVTKQL